MGNGTPLARPITAAAATSPATGSGSASATAPAPPSTRLSATHRDASARRSSAPPPIRLKNASSSVSEPAAAANSFDRPWCSSSVTTQFPTTTLKPNEAA